MIGQLGFIGTGTITEAIVTGLLSSGEAIPSMVVSPRTKAIADRLSTLSSRVLVAKDNQGVIDAADTVFLAVRPDVAEGVIRELRFRSGQRVVSLIAGIRHDTLRNWIEESVDLVRAMPLPFVASRTGVTVIFPPNPQVEMLFTSLGTAVPCSNIEQFDQLTAAGALMGTYFGILEIVVGWLVEKGIGEAEARAHMTSLFFALGKVAVDEKSRPLAELRREFSTKGGFNEQMFRIFESEKGPRSIIMALESVLKRAQS